MQSKTHMKADILIILMVATLSACSASKPTFAEPTLIIDRPLVTQSAPSSLAFFSSASSVSSLGVSSSVSSSQPPSVLIKVPFAPQAPFAVWDPLHEEACEEMALIMVHHFLQGTPLSREDAETEVQAMIAWERENGYADDVTVQQLGDIAKALYGYNVRVITDVTAEMLRKELRSGNPVIIPAAGRALKNPFFSGEGPFYHMLTVTGYNENGFITNDPGTKQGEKYWYSTDVLLNALHDWTGVKEEIATGAKNALVVER